LAKNSFNHRKISNLNQSNFLIKIKNLWSHMIVLHIDLISSLILLNVEIEDKEEE